MDKIKKFFYTPVLFSFLTGLYAKPGGDDVREALGRIIKKVPEPGEKNRFLEKIFTAISRFFMKILGTIGVVGFFVGIALIIILVFIAIILISRFIAKKASRNFSGRQKKESEDVRNRESYLELFRAGEASAKNGNFSEAIVYLHKSSILFLIDKKYLNVDEKYTNNAIKIILEKDKKYLQPFVSIARQSEIVIFKHKKIGKEIFSPLFAVYKKYFLEAV